MFYKKKSTVIILWGFIYLFFLMSSACRILPKMRQNDEETRHFFSTRGLSPQINYYTSFGRKVRYISIGNDSLPTVLLIHGAPGSLNFFQYILSDSSLLANMKCFALDRPGYGYSGLGSSETSIQRQAQIIKPLLDSLHHHKRPVIVFGTSFGGPIACRLAIDYPNLVDGLVLGAPALAPGEEKIFKISYLLRKQSRLTRWMFPTSLCMATDEKFSHQEELLKMMPLWGKLKTPIIYMQGVEDHTVYTTNEDFIKRYAINAPYLETIMIPHQKHFLTYPQKKLIIKSIIKMSKMLENKKNSL